MRRAVAVVYPPDSGEASVAAEELIELFKPHNITVFVDFGENLPEDCELVISLGGDGSLLHAARLALPRQVPVLGINLGHLGYLTQAASEDLEAVAKAVAERSYEVEKRATVSVEVMTSGQLIKCEALNEVVIQRARPGQTVRMELQIAGEPLAVLSADGLLVASPTGSTAYNLSVRGPIVDPELAVMVISPISAHSFFDRSLVVPPSKEVLVRLKGNRDAMVIVDGREEAVVSEGAEIRCFLLPERALLVRLSNQQSFYGLLRTKFGLNNA